jgi:N4-gp56 family major capsid protein
VADVLTGLADLSIDQSAYDRFAYYALRPELYFDRASDVQATNQAMPGTAVIFTLFSDLSVASTALNESTDVDTVALADAQVTVTLVEYGNAVKTTAKLRGTAFIPLDPVVANIVGFNAGVSIDTVARDVLKAGTNVRYAGQAVSRATVIPTDLLVGNNARRALADLRGANVATLGGDYTAYIHPDVSYDFRGATTGGNWRDPHTYSDPTNIWNGEIGKFENIRWVETSRAPIFADSGSSTTLTDVYRTIVLGGQSMAKAHSMTDGNGPFPKVVPGPVTDDLRRFVPMGWYWLGGYSIFRQAAVRAIESASSIGTNA